MKNASAYGRTVQRLLREVQFSPWLLTCLIVSALLSVVAGSMAPLLLGKAIDVLVAGSISVGLPGGLTREDALLSLEASGHTGQAAALSRLDFTPGVGVSPSAFVPLLLGMMALFLTSGLLSWGQGAILNRTVHRAIKNLRQRIDDAYQSLPLSRFDQHRRGDLLSRATNDIDNVTNAMSQALGQILTTIFSIVVLFGIMFWLSPLLTAITVILLPIAGFLTKKIITRNMPLFVRQMQVTGSITSQMDEAIAGHDITTSLGRQDDVIAQFTAANKELANVSWRAQFIAGLAGPVTAVVSNLSFVALCMVGILRVASGSVSLGELQVFIQYNRQLSQPMAQLMGILSMMQAGIASANRIFEVLDWPEGDRGGQASGTRGGVELIDVRFAYPDRKSVLEGVNLQVSPGDSLAIVGATGAGKSTLIDLLCFFRPADSGKVMVQGICVQDWDVAELRKRVGVVFQDPWIFAGTIRENVSYGAEDASESDLLAAVEAARVAPFAAVLPDGLETVLQEGGSSISHGQRQLICIARVFLKNPDILILDEATSAVDSRTEMLVQQALADLSSDRTTIVIAHRLTTIDAATTVAVLENGCIVETGSPQVLGAQEGAFARLLRDQAAAFGTEQEVKPMTSSMERSYPND